ncbi:MAG: hypothetical protein KBG15_23060 [Kofleriaceae bacterium]|nr:hypothetical protein [Kofleriaceae bacterium]
MTLRAATDSGVVVFPRLPLPSQTPMPASHRGQSPRKKNPLGRADSNAAASPRARPTWYRRIVATSAVLAVGLAIGFVVRPELLPSAELAQRKAQVAALTEQQSQAQLEIANLQSRDSQRATTLRAVQADLTQALASNATLRQTQAQALTQAQTAQLQTSAAQLTRVAQLNKHFTALLTKTNATLQATDSGIIVRFPDTTLFAHSPNGNNSIGYEAPAPALLLMVEKLDAALAAPPSPLQRVQIRSVVRSPPAPRGRRNRAPIATAIDPWTQSALRAAMLGKLLREHRHVDQLGQLAISVAGTVDATGPRRTSTIEIEVTLAN